MTHMSIIFEAFNKCGIKCLMKAMVNKEDELVEYLFFAKNIPEWMTNSTIEDLTKVLNYIAFKNGQIESY